MIDIHTIGTRGGSIARMDAAGGLSIGPDSAGAVPGPAAYGNGGRKRTLTDANLVLGRLDPENFLGGEMSLDIATAQAVIGELAAHIGLDPLRTAEGVVAVANNDMANAIHARTVQKDLDVRDYALVAFGDGGPLHAAEVARLIGIPEVIMPICPGINSALGLLTTDLSYDAVRTQFQSSTAIDTPGLSAAFDDMHATLGDQFAADGLDVRDVAFRRADDLRYVGQGYELRVAFSGGEFSDTALAEIFRNFHRQHEDEYGHAFPDNPIEIVNVRLKRASDRNRIGAETRTPAATTGGRHRRGIRPQRQNTVPDRHGARGTRNTFLSTGSPAVRLDVQRSCKRIRQRPCRRASTVASIRPGI
jgi:N-methylhydantoinase A/oxoprolinase/acetone carboxylase beta subunit